MFNLLSWWKNAFHADWFSLRFEITKFLILILGKYIVGRNNGFPLFFTETLCFPPYTSTRTCVFHQALCFPRPGTPVPHTPGSRVFHQPELLVSWFESKNFSGPLRNGPRGEVNTELLHLLLLDMRWVGKEHSLEKPQKSKISCLRYTGRGKLSVAVPLHMAGNSN